MAEDTGALGRQDVDELRITVIGNVVPIKLALSVAQMSWKVPEPVQETVQVEC
jgi:hypothetical protein